MTWLRMLERQILLPLPPKCSDYRHAPPHPGYVVLGIEARASCMLGKSSANQAMCFSLSKKGFVVVFGAIFLPNLPFLL